MRQPGPCVRALCEPVALLLSKNMTCAGPRRNATPSEHCLHTSHCTLHTPHSTLHTCTSPHLNSSHLSSSHLMSCLPICQLSSSSPFSFHLSTAQPSHLTEASLNSSRLFCTSESLRHRCIYTEGSLQNTLYYKACTKHFPVQPCTTQLAQSNYSPVVLCTQDLKKHLSPHLTSS